MTAFTKMTRADRNFFIKRGMIAKKPDHWQLTYAGQVLETGPYAHCMARKKKCVQQGGYNDFQFKLERI